MEALSGELAILEPAPEQQDAQPIVF
jgi:hypothetical protein